MQSLKLSELPESIVKELEGANFCILSAGRFPKVLDKDTDSIALGVRFKGIETHRDGFCPKTGAPQKVAKTPGELSEEIGNVDHPEFSMFRIDRD